MQQASRRRTESRVKSEQSSLSRRLTKRERDRLEQIMEKRNPNGPLDASVTALHGFLTAIISGPRIPTSEWTDVVFGHDSEKAFETIDEARRAYTLLMRFNNEVAAALLPDDDTQFQIMIDQIGEPPEHLIFADDWCRGYMVGMSLRNDDWEAAAADPDFRSNLEPIFALGDPGRVGRPPIDPDAEEYVALMDRLPDSAEEIWDWWRTKFYGEAEATDADRPAPYRRPTPKISPNAPCPCGSGKKYKKCCGSTANSNG